MMELDQLIAKLKASIPDIPNAAYCRPVRVADTLVNIAHLERLVVLDACVRMATEAFAPEPTKEIEP